MVVYDAFVSYSHAKDKPIAAALQSVIQKLGKPWYRRRALRVFRDDTSLSATPQLWPTIEQALMDSRFLIVLASPEAAASKWVNREITWWLEHKSAETILIAITEGKLKWDHSTGDFSAHHSMSLPPVLAGHFVSEPKWVDLNAYRDGANPRDSRFIEAGADFAAAICGMPKEDLLSQEVRQQRRALTLAWSAAASLLVLAGASTWQWREAAAQRDRAEKTLAAATETANNLVMDVAVKIRNRLGVPVHLVRDILTRARNLLDRLSSSGEISSDLRGGIARALRELATTLFLQGDFAAALEAAEHSRNIMLELIAEHAANEQWQRELSLSYNRVAEALSRAGRRAEALQAFQLAFDVRKMLADRAPDNAERRRDLAVSYERIGDELFVVGEIDDALENYQYAFDIRTALVLDDPKKGEWARDLSVSHEKIGDVHFNMRAFESAMTSYQTSLEIRRTLAAEDQTSAEAQRDIAVSRAKIGDVWREMDRGEGAVEAYRLSLAIRQNLAATDPGNSQWQVDLLSILLKLAEVGDEPSSQHALSQDLARRLDAEGKLPDDLKRRLQLIKQRLSQP